MPTPRHALVPSLATATLTVCLTAALAQGSTARLAPDGVAGKVYYAPFPVEVKVDGLANDWAGVPRVAVNSGPYKAKDDKTNLIFAAAADERNLYLLAEVTDASIIAGKHDLDFWNEDSVEFYLNASPKLDATSYTKGITQLTFPAVNLTSPKSVVSGINNTVWDKVTFKMLPTAGGYTLEASLPLETADWKVPPVHGTTLGFQVHLNAAYSKDRDTKLIWSLADTADNSWENPSLFGRLVFYRVGETSTPAPSDAK
jgi:hypothetical protein